MPSIELCNGKCGKTVLSPEILCTDCKREERIKKLEERIEDLQKISECDQSILSRLIKRIEKLEVKESMPAKNKKSGWVNIYPKSEVQGIYETEKIANHRHRFDRIACVKVEWAE